MRRKYVVFLVAVVVGLVECATKFAPNHFLGTCLDAKWVEEIEATLNISANARDDLWRLVHPHLHAAESTWLFKIDDPRIANKTLDQIYTPSCYKMPFSFFGVDAEVDPTTRAVTKAGTYGGSLVVEYGQWTSHQLTTLVFSILAEEVLGYRLSFFDSFNVVEMAARMSSARQGLCTPVHVNVEVRPRAIFSVYANESYSTGSHAYVSRSGLYTTNKFIDQGDKHSPPFDPDYWRDYTRSEELIAALDADLLLNNANYYPPTASGCDDGILGCKNSCSKTDTCTTREQQGGKCLGAAFMLWNINNGWGQAVFANKKIPAYFCFLSQQYVENYAVEMEAKNVPVLFFHFEPDTFHYIHKGKFSRVTLPRALPELIKVATGTFGEHGYGKATDNPVAVDFPSVTLSLYAATLVSDSAPVEGLLSNMALTEDDVDTLFKTYVDIAYNGASAIEPDDAVFSAACQWVRANYATWQSWLERLPLCSLFEHTDYSFHHCDDSQPREIRWAWKQPHPLDPTRSYACDGGMAALPSTLYTSKSCAWLKTNLYSWLSWTLTLPTCDAQFYTFDVSDCDASSQRIATYHWLLPDPTDETKSIECEVQPGAQLPVPVKVACEFTPFTSVLAKAVAIIAGILGIGFVIMIGFVLRHRHEPIIKRSQFEFLLVMITGGIMMCGAAVVYAGEPSRFLCAARPLVTSLGFTLIFGSLVVKSLRVYRVFMSGAMKRIVLSTKTMFKILGLFVSVDLLILIVWFIVDFPTPKQVPTVIGALGGATIDYNVCQSSSFILSALLIFWKAIVLFMGLYLSFLIRKVSSDFQESIWIFSSSLVVLFGSIIILPMAYLVELPATVFYAFLAFMLLVCTTLVVSMMLVPKMFRLHETATDRTSIETSGEVSSMNNTSSDDSKPDEAHKVHKVRLGIKAQVAVTPVEHFNAPSQDTIRKTKPKSATPGAADVDDDA